MKYFMPSTILDTEKEQIYKYKIMIYKIWKNKLQTDQNSSKVLNCSVEIILQPNCCTELHWKTSQKYHKSRTSSENYSYDISDVELHCWLFLYNHPSTLISPNNLCTLLIADFTIVFFSRAGTIALSS